LRTPAWNASSSSPATCLRLTRARFHLGRSMRSGPASALGGSGSLAETTRERAGRSATTSAASTFSGFSLGVLSDAGLRRFRRDSRSVSLAVDVGGVAVAAFAVAGAGVVAVVGVAVVGVAAAVGVVAVAGAGVVAVAGAGEVAVARVVAGAGVVAVGVVAVAGVGAGVFAGAAPPSAAFSSGSSVNFGGAGTFGASLPCPPSFAPPSRFSSSLTVRVVYPSAALLSTDAV
jgi:hypothetical protein